MSGGRAIRLLLVGGDERGHAIVSAAFPTFPVDWCPETSPDAWVTRACDLVLLRHGAHREGNGVLRDALSRSIGVPVILICDRPDPAMEADAIAIGASDVLLADQLGAPLLDRAVRYALERARAIAELRHSESRFRMLIEGSPDAILVHSRGVLLYVNPAAVTMLGYDLRLELVARPVADIVHADSLASTWVEVRNLVERGVTA